MIYFLNYITTILVLFILNIRNFCCSIINENNFIDLILLPSGDYFVLLDIGIYIYDSNFINKEAIYNFTEQQKIKDIYCYRISELKTNYSYFITVFTFDSNLFIYEVNDKKFYNNINLKFIINDNHHKNNDELKSKEVEYHLLHCDNESESFNIIPYNYENSTIEYIIYFMSCEYFKDKPFYQINFFLYDINLLDENPKTIEKVAYIYKEERNDGFSLMDGSIKDILNADVNKGKNENIFSIIDNYYISCRYNILDNNKKGLICFYYVQNCDRERNCDKRIVASIFDIEKNFTKIKGDEENILWQEAYIFSIIPNNKNNIFACIIYYYYDDNDNDYDYDNNDYQYIFELYCYMYSIKENILTEQKRYTDNCKDLYIYSFQSSNEDLILCQRNNDYINNSYYLYEYEIFSLDENFTHIDIILLKKTIYKECYNSINAFYLTYFPPNNYNLIDDCQPKEQINKNDSLVDNYSSLISSSENLSIGSSLPSEFSYSSNIINPLLNSSNILSYDTASYSNIPTSTDFSANISNFFEIYNYSKNSNSTNIFNYNISNNDRNMSNYTNIYNDSKISNYIDESNYFNLTDFINSTISKGKEILENKINIDKKDVLDNIPQIIDCIEIGKNYEVEGEDYTLIIKPINSSYLSNSTHINFNKCEKLLRDALNISSSRIITFLQMEIKNNKDKSLVNQVEYQVYDDKKTLLDLSLCKDIDIEINYAIKENSLDIKSITEFNNKGIDVFNINDSFFNDICHPYSDSNNDIVLEDRIKDIYQNYSLCDDGCSYNGLDLINKTISCNCKVKTNMSLNESIISLKQFNEIKIESNFGLIKCYELVFSLNGKSKNIGFWIFLFFILAHIPLLFIYFCKGIEPTKEYIISEMEKYGYIKSNNNKKGKIVKKNTISIENPTKKKGNKNSKKKKIKNVQNLDNDSSFNIIKSLQRKINNLNPLEIKINESKDNTDFKKSSEVKENLNIILKDKKPIKEAKVSKILINNVILLGKSGNKSIKKNKTMGKMKKRIDVLATSGLENTKNITEKGNDINNFGLININLNNIKDYTPKNSLLILNNYTFEEAIKYDMRSICAIFYIFLLSKQAAFHVFLYRSPLESFHLRFCLLIFIISSDLALNAFFYLDDKISKKYKYAQNLFLFAFNNNITIILMSTLIGFIFMTLFTNLSNSTNNIRDLFRNEEEKILKNKNYKVTEKCKKEILEEVKKILSRHKLKVIILITIEVILMLFFWYYVTAFCHVYSSTQISWLLDSFLSILSRLVIELLFSLGFAKLYRMSVEANIICIYKFVIFFYCFA